MNQSINPIPNAFDVDDVERAVLGALLLEPVQMAQVGNLLKAEMFEHSAHQMIYEVIAEMYLNDSPIDMLTVTQGLKKKEYLDQVGGAFYVTALTSNVASAVHIENHARIIIDCYCRRKIANKLLTIYEKSQNFQVSLDEIVGFINNIISDTVNQTFQQYHIRKYSEHLQDYSESASKKDEAEYLMPVIDSVRAFAKYWKPGELIIIAGRPGMGKTAYALYEMFAQSKRGNSVLYFSLEMAAKELVARTIAIESEVSSQRIADYNLSGSDWIKIDNALGRIENVPFYIDDNENMDINYLLIQAKIYARKYDVKAIAIDYLQLISMHVRETRALAVSECTRKLKMLARSLNVPIFLICQLNREVEKRQSSRHEPQLSDLKESGAIEQDADKVMFVVRMDYYYPDDPRIAGTGYIKMAKNRSGKMGKAFVNISHDVARWSQGEDQPF